MEIAINWFFDIIVIYYTTFGFCAFFCINRIRNIFVIVIIVFKKIHLLITFNYYLFIILFVTPQKNIVITISSKMHWKLTAQFTIYTDCQ
jgi:hypothetical protein